MSNTNCHYCTSCTSCTSCNYCYSCKNLKMTEYNLFCTAEDKNRDWFQRPRYQVFNTQITEEEYGKIKIPTHTLEFDPRVHPNYMLISLTPLLSKLHNRLEKSCNDTGGSYLWGMCIHR